MQQADKWKKILDDIASEVQKNYSSITDDMLNKKPNADRWSIAQILEHIIIINESYYPVIENVRNRKYKAGYWGSRKFMTNFWFKTIFKSIHPDNKKKSKTQTIWQPALSYIDGDIVNRFLQHQNQFKKFIDDCSDLVESNTVIHSPATKIITYTISQAFEIITTHEQRHLMQAKEMLQRIA
ncbi:MAG: DinB family protein [Chitinophagales bacterium]